MPIQTTANLLGGGGGGVVRVLIPAVTGSEITAFADDQLDITMVQSCSPVFANKRRATEYNVKTTSRAVDVRVAKKSKTMDAITGEIVSSGDANDSMEAVVGLNSTMRAKIRDIIKSEDQPVIFIWTETDINGNAVEDYHLLGYLEGDLEDAVASDEIKEFTLRLNGGVGFTDGTAGVTAYIAAYKTTPGATTADGFDTATQSITLADAVAGDLTKLLSGEMVAITHA